MKPDRIMIAAPASGSGKTTVTCALLELLKEKGLQVVAFKCGPDYIDPMYHRSVIGVPSENLDTFFTEEEKTRRILLESGTEDKIAVLEGVMGLYDGLGGVREEGSSYHLAQTTRTPIVLVVDAKGMGRSVIALLAGFLAYDKAELIKGVIFNRMSPSYCETIRSLVEEELGICVLGCLPEQKEDTFKSRHLGLYLPQELPKLRQHLQKMAGELQKTVSVDRLLKFAAEAEPLEEVPDKEEKLVYINGNPTIAVAKDEAFCFYYEANLRLLQSCGARLEFFSPLHDRKLPEHCCGLLLGGGYPELYAGELSDNQEMLAIIREKAVDGLPIVAECGGFMYLHSYLEDQEKGRYRLADVVQGGCWYTGKLVRFGYITVQDTTGSFLPENAIIKGHEFHYYDSDRNGSDCIAGKPVSGRNYPCIWADQDHFMGFPHLYYPSNPAFAVHFVERAEAYRLRKGW